MWNTYWKPKFKYQVVEWIYNHYGGKYSKHEIRQRNVWGWYKDIREGRAK